MAAPFLPNAPTPLILSLSKDMRQGQPSRMGFDELSLSGIWDIGGEA